MNNDSITHYSGVKTSPKYRFVSIDFLKFIAVLFITNSHMNNAYGEYNALATGGAIGDVLFFFVSGFTLFMGRVGAFDTWYKRRIRRIYPSVFGWAIVGLLCGITSLDINSMLKGGGEFISAIMVYYVVLYFIRKYAMNKLSLSFVICSLVVLLWYIFLFPEKQDVLMYKRFVRWPCYFLFMLMGAMTGVKVQRNNGVQNSGNNWINVMMLLFSIITFYGIQIIGKKILWVSYIQIVSLIPLMGVIYYLYLLACSRLFKRIYDNKIMQCIILVVGGLCLEIYFVQMPILIGDSLPFGFKRDSLQFMFPLNIPIIIIIILPLAYITRTVGRFFAQTFDSVEGYQWGKIFELKG